MASRLDRLLEAIDPVRTYEPLWARADEGLNTFPMENAREDDWNKFNRLLATFFCHMENVMLRLKSPMPVDYGFHGSRCSRLLRKEYGDQADKAAFEMARTGVEGGLYGVLKTLARLMVEEYTGNEIRARVSDFWNSLSMDEQLELPMEYIEKHGHLMPSELIEDGAGRIRINFTRVLEEHPLMIMRLRNSDRHR